MKLDSAALRKTVLAILLLVSVAVALWLALQDEEERAPAAPAQKSERQVKSEGAPQRVQIQSLKRGSQGVESSDDVFAAHSWFVPAAPVAAPPPPAPTAPVLPFTYGGQLVDGKTVTVFLIHGEENLMAKRGDTLLGTYYVEDVQPKALVLTYLPLKQLQVMPIGEMN